MQSILVTGGAGFIGRHLVDSITKAAQDFEIVIIDIKPAPHQYSDLIRKGKLVYYHEDIRSREHISDIVKRERVEKCVHLAAKTSITDTLANNELFGINVNGTSSVLRACADAGVHSVIFTSSAAVYGEGDGSPTTEDHELRPISEYGISKLCGEELVRIAKESGKLQQSITLRLFNVYGRGQNPAYAGVMTKFASRLSKRLTPVIYGDGSQTRDFVSVSDTVDAIISAMNSKVQDATLNIGTGSPTTITNLAKKMMSIYGLDLRPVHKQARSGEIYYSCADVRSAKKILHFQSKVSLEYGLKEFLKSSLRNSSKANLK